MRTLGLAELAGVLDATMVAGDDPSVEVGPDVVIDARKATPGSLFVAIRGERVDGHDFVQQARDNGAVAVLATRDTGVPVGHVLVEDTVAALSRLARHVVDEARGTTPGLTVVAITGSSGKTSTKDILAQLLEAAGPTVSPVGSFNNEIGVPLTACQVDADTRYLVSEMGARGIGHIAWLTSLVHPDVSVVLNVGTAHLGEFGSADNIALAKGELVEALDADDAASTTGRAGWAVLNADDRRVVAMASRTQSPLAVFTLAPDGLPDAAARARVVVRGVDVQHDDLQRHSFTLVVERRDQLGAVESSERHEVALPLLGAHQVANALAAAAAAIVAGVPVASVARSLNLLEHRSRWRMQLDERADGLAVLNDSYNANPDSMAAALRTLAELARSRRASDPGARGIAVLGEMLELGEATASEHRATGRLAGELGLDVVLAVAEPQDAHHAADIAEGAREAGVRQTRVVRKADVARVLADGFGLRPGDVVLVKASRGIALDEVADQLLQGGNPC